MSSSKKKVNSPLALKHPGLKSVVSYYFLDLYENFNDIVENIKQKFPDILFKCKLDFAPQYACSTNNAGISFGKFPSIHRFLTKENEKVC